MNGTPNDSIFLNQRRYEEIAENGVCSRDAFQRDRDRIMHSRAFRRIKYHMIVFVNRKVLQKSVLTSKCKPNDSSINNNS